MKNQLILTLTAAGLLAFNASIHAQQGAAPDPQMKAVLDELATLGGKPVETLSPVEARKQPSPADARRFTASSSIPARSFRGFLRACWSH